MLPPPYLPLSAVCSSPPLCLLYILSSLCLLSVLCAKHHPKALSLDDDAGGDVPAADFIPSTTPAVSPQGGAVAEGIAIAVDPGGGERKQGDHPQVIDVDLGQGEGDILDAIACDPLSPSTLQSGFGRLHNGPIAELSSRFASIATKRLTVRRWLVTFILLASVPLLRSALTAIDCFKCTPLKYVMRFDSSLDCHSVKHRWAYAVAAHIFLIYIALMPVYIGRSIWKASTMDHFDWYDLQRTRMGPLYDSFRPSARYFELAVLVKRVFESIVTILLVARQESVAAAAAVLLANVVYFGLLLRFRPWVFLEGPRGRRCGCPVTNKFINWVSHDVLNKVDMMATIIRCINCLVGLLLAFLTQRGSSALYEGGAGGAVSAVMIFINVGGILVQGYIIISSRSPAGEFASSGWKFGSHVAKSLRRVRDPKFLQHLRTTENAMRREGNAGRYIVAGAIKREVQRAKVRWLDSLENEKYALIKARLIYKKRHHRVTKGGANTKDTSLDRALLSHINGIERAIKDVRPQLSLATTADRVGYTPGEVRAVLKKRHGMQEETRYILKTQEQRANDAGWYALAQEIRDTRVRSGYIQRCSNRQLSTDLDGNETKHGDNHQGRLSLNPMHPMHDAGGLELGAMGERGETKTADRMGGGGAHHFCVGYGARSHPLDTTRQRQL